MNTTIPENWHELTESEVLHRLQSDAEHGLFEAEAEERLRRHGPNEMTSNRGRSPWLRFLLQFAQPLMYVLLVAAAITLALGEHVDAAVIFGVTFINAVVGYIQESKAEKAIEALSKMVRTEATVRRDGRWRRMDSAGLVPGDIVRLQSGDKIPADLRLLLVRNLQVDESALTGESLPAEKKVGALAGNTGLGDRKNLGFAGTLVTYGQAEGVVIATGNRTETGRIAKLIHEADELTTPLTLKIAQLSKLLLWIILGLAAMIFAVGIARGGTPSEMFMAAVALAVGAIPEGLPAAVTVTLAIGVSRMAKHRAIIRKLPAVEALGSTTIICSDKTGTLTENRMTVRRIFAGGKSFEVSGSGYHHDGAVSTDGRPVDPSRHEALRETLLAGLLNNDAQLVPDTTGFKVEGDPTEAALIVAALKSGLIPADTHSAHPRLDVIPFESEHQFMATLHHRGDGRARVIFKKGSVERLLPRCTHMLGDAGELLPPDPGAVQAAVAEMASDGMRVIAFARVEVAHDLERIHANHVHGGLTFIGLQGMIDPPRPEAIVSVRKCRQAGIRVKMITGDHVITARAIARQLGLRGDGEELIAVTGAELEQIADADLPALAERATVFARVAPEQKLKLVRALQSRGHIVAMTGDGVNDAPALKQSDIGVAMGITGTDVAKGAADMLLTDDNFATIETAVEEGRSVFDNLTKFIIWTLPTNIGQGSILLAAVLWGGTLPLLPVQILWINMATTILLGMMLIFEPKEHDIMQRPPRDPNLPILTPLLMLRIGLVSLIILSGAFGAFLWEQEARGKTLIEARTTAVNVIVMVECFYLLNCRSLLQSMFSVGLWSNLAIFGGIAAMIGAQVIITHTELMNRLFHTAPIDGTSWLYVGTIGLAAYGIIEFEKALRRRMARRS